MEEVYPSLHDQAKVLNNRAAYVITTTSNYEEGINLFVKALKLTERSILSYSSKEVQGPCSCKFCSLESCFVLSEERKYQHRSSLYSSPSSRIDIVIDGDTNNKQESHATKMKNDSIDQDNDVGFVYRRLLRIHDHSIKENHYMGSTLSLVITFNLALAHHLRGIDNDNNKESLSSPSNPTDFTMNFKNSVQNAVKFYELTHQLQVNYTEQQSCHTHNNMMEDDDDDHDDNDSIVISLRLTMIVSNNIGQIHRVVGNSKKYVICLQHVLSSIMYVGQQLVPNTVFNSTEFDGFIRNVLPIVFHDSIYASAA